MKYSHYIPLALVVLNTGRVFAQVNSPTGPGSTVTIPNPLGCSSFSDCLLALIPKLVTLLSPVMAIIILWGGIQIMTARGNPEQVSQGGKTIWWGVIGFGIILLATSVPYILKSAFGLGP